MTLSATHRFAWDGLSFDVPTDWDLAYQETRLGITRIRLEDPVAVRLSAEWAEPAGGMDLGRIMARFESSSKKLRRASKDSLTLSKTPEDWSAILYRFEDGRRLGLVFYLSRQKDLFGFFQLHFDPGPPGEAEALLRRFMASFTRHVQGPVPWACYDIRFTTPPGFRLNSATFNPGLKRFTFGRSLRQLHVWHISLADLVLKKERGPLQWAAKTLNASDLVQGPVFEAFEGGLRSSRPGFLSHWHFMELLRGCLKYRAGLRHDHENNRLVLTCYQYRFASDLDWLNGTDLPVDSITL
jgi:hypothetical protein